MVINGGGQIGPAGCDALSGTPIDTKCPFCGQTYIRTKESCGRGIRLKMAELTLCFCCGQFCVFDSEAIAAFSTESCSLAKDVLTSWANEPLTQPVHSAANTTTPTPHCRRLTFVPKTVPLPYAPLAAVRRVRQQEAGRAAQANETGTADHFKRPDAQEVRAAWEIVKRQLYFGYRHAVDDDGDVAAHLGRSTPRARGAVAIALGSTGARSRAR